MVLRKSLLGVSLAAVSMAAASTATAAVRTPGRLAGVDPAVVVSMVAGEQRTLAAAGIAQATEFVATRAVLELRETAGATLVVRLTPQVQQGLPPHGGRIVVLRAGERRLIQLGMVFKEKDLAGNDVLVEALEGDGRLAARLAGGSGGIDWDDVPAEVPARAGSATALAAAAAGPRRKLAGKALTSVDLIDRAESGGHTRDDEKMRWFPAGDQ